MSELVRVLNVGELSGDFAQDLQYILSHTPPLYLDVAFKLLYGESVQVNDGMTFLLLLTRGLRVNQFHRYHAMLQVMRL